MYIFFNIQRDGERQTDRCTHMYMYVNTCIKICLYDVHMCMCIYIYVYTYVDIIYMQVSVCLCVCACVSVCVYIQIYA
jgi:hypothetical protein